LRTSYLYYRRKEKGCEEAYPLYCAFSRRGLHPIRLAYNPRWPDGRLKLTVSAFNRLKPVCQQSW